MIYIRDAIDITESSKRNSLMTIGTAAYCGFRELGETVMWYKKVEDGHPSKQFVYTASIAYKTALAGYAMDLAILRDRKVIIGNLPYNGKGLEP